MQFVKPFNKGFFFYLNKRVDKIIKGLTKLF